MEVSVSTINEFRRQVDTMASGSRSECVFAPLPPSVVDRTGGLRDTAIWVYQRVASLPGFGSYNPVMPEADRVPYVYRAPTTFHILGEEEQHQPLEEGMLNLRQGQGVLWHDGRRFRVKDSWFSFDKHGRFGMGLHVFLERITALEDDLLLQLAPDYFSDQPD